LQLTEGARLPAGYGHAYWNHESHLVVAYPVPLNWVAGWWQKLRWRVKSGPEKTSVLRRTYAAGYAQALADILGNMAKAMGDDETPG
jgi:hypothetical protein